MSAVHTPLLQSAPLTHANPSAQGLHSKPPQSVAVSPTSSMPLAQFSGTHAFSAHKQLAFAPHPPAQSLPSKHSTQVPSPSHRSPVPLANESVHGVPAEAGVSSTVFEEGLQLNTTQLCVGEGTSFGSKMSTTSKFGPQVRRRQSPSC